MELERDESGLEHEQNVPAQDSGEAVAKVPQPLNAVQRRILGVLIEKARTTPDAYPLSLNGLVTACNQKTNRYPLMNLTAEQAEVELANLRDRGIVAEVHGGGRVPKYRHYGYDYMGVKGVEAAVMAELLLRGEQSVGDLRSRASRFEPIADASALLTILGSLEARKLVVALTPPGRGQMFTHNLYHPEELDAIRQSVASGVANYSASPHSAAVTGQASVPSLNDFESLKEEVSDLRLLIEQITDRLARLEG